MIYLSYIDQEADPSERETPISQKIELLTH